VLEGLAIDVIDGGLTGDCRHTLVPRLITMATEQQVMELSPHSLVLPAASLPCFSVHYLFEGFFV